MAALLHEIIAVWWGGRRGLDFPWLITSLAAAKLREGKHRQRRRICPQGLQSNESKDHISKKNKTKTKITIMIIIQTHTFLSLPRTEGYNPHWQRGGKSFKRVSFLMFKPFGIN